MWLHSFTNEDERYEAMERASVEGLPELLYKNENNFIVSGPTTPQ